MKRNHFINNDPLPHAEFCPLCENQITNGSCHCAIFSKLTEEMKAKNVSVRRVGNNSTIFSTIETHPALTTQDLIEARNRMEVLERALRDNEQI